MKKLYFILFIVTTFPVKAQQPEPNLILNKVKTEYEKICDFTVNAEIIVDVEFVNIPPKNAVVYYKAPDRYRFKSDGFILIPKKGINFSLLDLINKPYTAVYIGETQINGKSDHEIRVIPDDHKGEIVLATLWIDPKSCFIEKVEANTRNSGSYEIELSYGKVNMPLPREIRVTFEISKMRFPMKFIGDHKVENTEGKIPEQAVVTIIYTDYKVNSGLDDTVFIEEKEQ